ncbi:MAG: M23 family metallopeptidase [Acidobacteriota bacterium]
MLSKLSIFGSFVVLLVFAAPQGVEASGYDPDPAWPLCGYATKPSGTYDCPQSRWGDPDIVNDTFGPRRSIDDDHDWHFGVDLHPGEAQMRVFASTCGWVRTLDDNDGADNNQRVVVQHYRTKVDCTNPPSSRPSCSGGDCYYTVYNHLSEIDSALATGSTTGYVSKGQVLGLTGQNCDDAYPCSGSYEHLHFEVLDPTYAERYDPVSDYSRSQRDALHPLRFLKVNTWDDDADNISVSFVTPIEGDEVHPIPTIEIEMPVWQQSLRQRELDLARVEVEVFDASALASGGALVRVAQFNESYPNLPTPDDLVGGGDVNYTVQPPFLDLEMWVRQYSYAKSSSLPYKEFISEEHYPGEPASDHPYKTPYSMTLKPDGTVNPVYDAALNKVTYEWGYHLHRTRTGMDTWGDFNGVQVMTPSYNRNSSFFQMSVRFTELEGVAAGDELCLKARALDIYGNATDWVPYGTCDMSPVATTGGGVEHLCNGLNRATWDAVPGATHYELYIDTLVSAGKSAAPAARALPGTLYGTTTGTSMDLSVSSDQWVYVTACNGYGCSERNEIGMALYDPWMCQW